MSNATDLSGLDVLLVDGDNLLHDVRGTRDEGGVAWLLPRLRTWRPDHIRIIVALDGHPPPGEARRKRATKGIDFQHSGSRSADDTLIGILRAQPYASRARHAIVTRDRGLMERARRAGGATRSVDWLMRLISSGPSTQGSPPSPKVVGIGQGKPPSRGHSDRADAAERDREPWQAGRGATRKKGNPRRRAKASRRR